eukprot:TRINITY_DN656_c0_g1_i1.p1 TRINITY_DN656_c0_g1~~TRINITY_DN656_c0_g1_i1.p1  ORF type:complete len:445 (+),score=35.66 TRINITY_DN656_c0_g1_i1:118-1452(+)
MSTSPSESVYVLEGEGPHLTLKLGGSDVVLKVPQDRAKCSARAKNYLKKKGVLTWCEEQRIGLQCEKKFAEGVGFMGCPFGHVANTDDPEYQELLLKMKEEHGELFVKKRSPANHDIITEFDNSVRMIEGESTLQEYLTVVLTTSPTQSNPGTDLIDAVYSTFVKIPGLEECHLIICCDGYDELGATDCSRQKLGFKRGCVSPESAAAYEGYKQNLKLGIVQKRAQLGLKTTVLEFGNERQGFGWAVRLALADHVRTKYTMVLQHDRYFETNFDLLDLLVKVMDPEPEKYAVVYFQNQSLMDHVQKIRNRVISFKNGKDSWSDPLFQPKQFEGTDVSLLPCLAWLDSTHVGLTTHLIKFLFGRKGIAAQSGVPIKRGCFPEDCINQVQVSALKEHGPSSHSRFKTWFINQPGTPQVRHLSGRVFNNDGTSGERARNILKEGQCD